MRSIVVYVLPLAILFHLLVTYLLFTQLHAGQHDITSPSPELDPDPNPSHNPNLNPNLNPNPSPNPKP